MILSEIHMNVAGQKICSNASQTRVRRLFLALAGVVCLSALAVGARAVSTSIWKPPVPPVVAVVDLQAIVKGLDERTVKDADLLAKGTEYKNNLDKMKKDLDDMKSSLEAAANPADKLAIQKRAYLKENELKFETEFATQQLDLLYGDLLRELHSKISAACIKIAKQNGYTMVLASDENADIGRGGRENVTRAISMKRMLYVEDSHDITPEVITLMNNEFAASGGKAVPPPTTPPANGAKPATSGGKP